MSTQPDHAEAEDPIWHELAHATLTSEGDPEDHPGADPEHDEYFFSRLAAELRAETHPGGS